MGATNFYHIIDAYSPREGFNALVDQAIYEHGADGYNGTISTCSLGCSVKKMTSSSGKYTKSVLKKAMKYMEDEDYGRKWEATCLDLGIVAYDVITAKKTNAKPKEKAEYRQKYVVLHSDFEFGEVSVGYRDTKKEADDLAMELAVKNNADYYVAKRPVKINRGDDIVTKIEFVGTRKKTVPKSVSSNAVVKPLHRYLFYGWAAC